MLFQGDSGGPLNCGTGFKTHSGVTSWVVSQTSDVVLLLTVI